MLLEKDLKQLFSQLSHEDVVQIPCGNNELTLSSFNHGSKILLSTPVYFGGNFIPSSVRKCASLKHPFKEWSDIQTMLHIDENKFEISLRYLGDIETLNTRNFNEVLEEFSGIADRWRLILDEHDRNDLVYVRK